MSLFVLFGKGFILIDRGTYFTVFSDLIFISSLFIWLGFLVFLTKKLQRSISFFSVFFGFSTILILHWLFEVNQLFGFDYTSSLFVRDRLIFPVAVFWYESTRVLNPIPFWSSQRLLQLLLPFNLIFPLPLESEYLRPVS